jgi:acyl-coenzyme A synthetase/AMP-(fatty) acid ligase
VTSNRVEAALSRDPDRIVCFARDGRERRARELASAAAQVAARLSALDGERWVLNLDDSFDFTAALLGCWAAGRTALLAPRPLLATLEPSAFDGVIESAGDSTAAPSRIVWEELESSSRPLGEIEPSAALVLYTSGSTGAPKAAARKLFNIEAELTAFESAWGDELGGARVYATVSHRHVYGLLFRILWPLLSRRAFASFDCEYPEQLLDPVASGNVLISSPAMLKRIGHLPDHAGRWRAVFSSGGTLPPDAAANVSRVFGVAAIEIYGSTETSGVAWRRAGSAGFTLLPSVEVRAPGELLEVRSPFSGCDDWQAMGDRASLRADGTLELKGRADRVAKIEDKRVSLSEIERRLLEHAFVKEAVALALEDRRRQYVGVVAELTDAGRAELKAHGKRAVNAALQATLRGKLDAVALPRAYRYPSAIPVDAQGKRHLASLTALFASKR